jgi:hypothetical protein
MAEQTLDIACTSTPQVVAGSIGAGGPYHGYIRIRMKMISGTGYLGDSGVTTAGYPLTTGDASIDLSIITGETLYVASSSGASPTLAVLRLNETT